jgi:ATP-dependent DNA helicase RecQ
MWPTGLPAVGVPLSGRIPPGEQPETGRAVGRLSDLGWGARLRAVFAPGPGGSTPVPEEVLAAVVEVLKAWAHGEDPWPARPVGVVTVASRRRPAVVTGVAARIAEVGRLPLLGAVERADDAPPGEAGARANSAQRVRELYDTFRVPAPLAARLGELAGPVLLVDDLVDTGWTLALVARELRRAGAPAVLPLALALAG